MIRTLIVYGFYEAPAPAYGAEARRPARRIVARVEVPRPDLGPNAAANRAARDAARRSVAAAGEGAELAALGDPGGILRAAWMAAV